MNLATWLRIAPKIEREYDEDERTLAERIRNAREYVDNHLHRADVVEAIPVNAPRGYLLMTPGDPNLYVGTGMTTPLRRIPTQPLT